MCGNDENWNGIRCQKIYFRFKLTQVYQFECKCGFGIGSFLPHEQNELYVLYMLVGKYVALSRYWQTTKANWIKLETTDDVHESGSTCAVCMQCTAWGRKF